MSALLLVGCIRDRVACVAEPHRIELSPLHRTRYGTTLVSISRSGRVTIRNGDGRLGEAVPDEVFDARDGRAFGNIKLLSADTSSGYVVLEEYSFSYQRTR